MSVLLIILNKAPLYRRSLGGLEIELLCSLLCFLRGMSEQFPGKKNYLHPGPRDGHGKFNKRLCLWAMSLVVAEVAWTQKSLNLEFGPRWTKIKFNARDM